MEWQIGSPEEYRVGLYIRLSKEDDRDGPSQSVSNQLSLLRDFAARQGLEVYDVYIDDGWSGTSFDRPAFCRLIQDIESRKVNMVVTKDLSRLGRDYIQTGHYMERYFPEHRVRYISLLDGVDTGVDSTANDITPFRAIMNDMYAKDISKKIISVKRDKQRKGLFIGGKPVYGYRMHPEKKNRIVVDPPAARVVKRVFAMALEGASCRGIAQQLNAEGVPTPAAYAHLSVPRPGPYAGKWSGERISDMLRNETYVGCMVQGRSRKVSYKSKKCVRRDPADWVVVPGTHEPIVDREAFERVQRLLSSRRTTRARTYDFPLKGLIFCRECGHPLAVVNRPNARGEERLYFICRTYQRCTRAGACTSHTARVERVTEAVLGAVRTALGAALSQEALLPLAREAAARAWPSLKRERQRLQEQIACVTQKMDRAYQDRLSGTLEEQDFRRVYERMRGERAALEERLAGERQEASAARREEWAQALARRYEERDALSRASLMDFVERVELSKDKRVFLFLRFRKNAAEAAAPRLQ